MFTQTWNKYLPAIAILLKRSAAGEQTLDMDHIDFDRAAAGRKIKFTFSNLQLNKGRMMNLTKITPIASELAQLLQGSELTAKLVRSQHFEFSLNSNFQLLIKRLDDPESQESPGEGKQAENNEPGTGAETAKENKNTTVP